MEVTYKGTSFLPTTDVLIELHTVLELLRANRATLYRVYTSGGPIVLDEVSDAHDMLELCFRARGSAKGGPMAKSIIAQSFPTPPVHDVVLPEALAKYAEDGETAEETKARLSQRWFELNRQNIALSQGSRVYPEMTEAERALLKELSMFDWSR